MYWVPRVAGKKALLVFDAGYDNGDFHVYEYVESLPSKAVPSVESWVERRYGYFVSWKLSRG